MSIAYKCQIKDTIPFTELLPFQGTLKSRSEEDINKLSASLLNDGLLMPFVIWHKPDVELADQMNYILDGHARYNAIQHLAEAYPEVLKQEYPVIIVNARDINEACNQLLQISSSYGKITPKGLEAFLSKVPNIKIESLGIHVKLPQIKLPAVQDAVKEDKSLYTIMKLRVKTADVSQITQVLSSCGVEIL